MSAEGPPRGANSAPAGGSAAAKRQAWGDHASRRISNAMWAARSDAAVWHPCTQMKRHETAPPLPIARARGAWLHDYEGGRYLDAVGSPWVGMTLDLFHANIEEPNVAA